MTQPYADEKLKEIFGFIFDHGDFDKIKPGHFAITAHRSVTEIHDLMESVAADRATRLAPNAVPETPGEGK